MFAGAKRSVFKRLYRWSSSKRIEFTLKDFRTECATPVNILQHIVDDMLIEMNTGLAMEGDNQLKMLVTYVDTLPTGCEEGLFYALDLGGTNFRVMRIQLGGKDKGVVQRESKEVSIPEEVMLGTNEELFDFLAEELAKFVDTEGEGFCLAPGQQRELGFTFSFPVKQTSFNSGTLMRWTKGFAIADTVGKDVVEELQIAMHRKGLDMRVAALVNDTVGTLARGKYEDDNVVAAVILGTGSNACYIERADAISKWTPLSDSGTMVINMEWGNFSSPQLPRTVYDEALDEESINRTEQIFEKMVSGMYLGDIVRRVIWRLAETSLFGEEVPQKLEIPFILRTPDVSAISADDSADLNVVTGVLKEVFGIQNSSLKARKIVAEVCDIVAARGGRLAGAGIVAILKKIGRISEVASEVAKTVIAVDGALYEHYPKFREYVKEAIVELIGKEAAANVDLKLSKDGSGIGATLLAAAHSSKAME